MDLVVVKKVMMLRVSTSEALDLVISLVSQIRNKSPNIDRLESNLNDGRYFSIAVHDEEKV